MYYYTIFDFAKSLSEEKMSFLSSKKTANKEIYHFCLNKNYQNRSKGDYYIIKNKMEEFNIKNIEKCLLKTLKVILKKYAIDKVLIIGLGNSDITCDSLGKEVVGNIITTNQYNDFYTVPKICVFNPETSNKTGIKSFSIIKMLVDLVKPNAIIIVDSLLTNNFETLNNTIEITDVGIIPGCYLNDSKLIDCNTFKIPVISIGVPLAIKVKDNIYTSALVSIFVKKYGYLIAKCLNKLFYST